MKKLINDPRAVVREMLEGLVGITPGLALLDGETVVVRADAPMDGQVALISGGGAGHEPAHAGYVGTGMLSAAVSGDVFASPPTDAVLAAIRAVAGPAGVLLIVKNYTGDRLNFGMAAELARAEGIPVEMVIVGDDVALSADGEHAGRRGIAGTVLVHKIAGAAAAAGLPLAEVKREAEDAIAAIGTMGVALSACTVPAAGRPGFTLAEEEIELGLGIHGEQGVRRERIVAADALVDEMLSRIVADKGIGAGDRVALMVNNLGATPTMELAIMARRALHFLQERGIVVERAFAGTFLTALEMAGCSLSLMRLDDRRLARLDAPTGATAWPRVPAFGPAVPDRPRVPVPRTHARPVQGRAATGQGRQLGKVLRAVFAALRDDEARLTELDRIVGDGDLGLSLARGAEAAERQLATWPLDDPAATLRALSATLLRAIGGTSGPLYAAFLLRAAGALQDTAKPAAADWVSAFQAGNAAVAELGGAGPGDRTMLDALLPAAEAMQAAIASGLESVQALERGVAAAREGAAHTATMTPRRGRSSYLAARAIGHADPGAEAVVTWLRAVQGALG